MFRGLTTTSPVGKSVSHAHTRFQFVSIITSVRVCVRTATASANRCCCVRVRGAPPNWCAVQLNASWPPAVAADFRAHFPAREAVATRHNGAPTRSASRRPLRCRHAHTIAKGVAPCTLIAAAATILKIATNMLCCFCALPHRVDELVFFFPLFICCYLRCVMPCACVPALTCDVAVAHVVCVCVCVFITIIAQPTALLGSLRAWCGDVCVCMAHAHAFGNASNAHAHMHCMSAQHIN